MHTMYLIRRLPVSAYKRLLYNNCVKHRSVSRLFMYEETAVLELHQYIRWYVFAMLKNRYITNTQSVKTIFVTVVLTLSYTQLKDTQKLSAKTQRNYLPKSISITYHYTYHR